MSLMWVFFDSLSHCACILFSFLNILLLIPNCMVTSPTFKVLTPNLSIFTRFILFTFAIIPFGSLAISIFSLITEGCNSTICTVIFWITNYSATLVRVTIPVYMIDGLLATIFYRKYFLFTTSLYGYVYITFTYSMALIWTLGLFYGSQYYIISSSFAVIIEITTLVLWNWLYHRNKKLHRILRFQANLKIRCQIITNIKTLRLCLLYNFLFSVFPLIFSLISLVLFVVFDKTVEVSFMFLSYNMCITICMIIRAKRHWHTRRTTRIYIKEMTEEKVKHVLSALGKAIPAYHTIDTHFTSLKNQWEIASTCSRFDDL